MSLQASKKLVAATGQQCLPLSMDVRQPQTIAAAVDEALKEFQRIDILINGEGAVGRGRVWAHCWEGCSPAQASLGAQRKQSSVCGTSIPVCRGVDHPCCPRAACATGLSLVSAVPTCSPVCRHYPSPCLSQKGPDVSASPVLTVPLVQVLRGTSCAQPVPCPSTPSRQ